MTHMTLSIDWTSHTTKNYDERPAGVVVDALVLHTGEGSEESDLGALTRPGTRKSAHYYVNRAGHIYGLVDPTYRAWHAGESSYQGRSTWNDFSIGVETEHKVGQDWPATQKEAIYDLFVYLIGRFAIKQRYVVAHRWIAQGRKFDPTNWPDEELKPWIASLYAGSPWTYALPGPNGLRSCGRGFYDFYQRTGGFAVWGYALTDELGAVDMLGRPCTRMTFERAVFKYVTVEGVHLALLHEVADLGWEKV